LTAGAVEFGITPNGLAREVIEEHLEDHLQLRRALRQARQLERERLQVSIRRAEQTQLDEHLRLGKVINGAWVQAHGLTLDPTLIGAVEVFTDPTLERLVKPILEGTAGRVVIAEQIEAILMLVGGCSLAEAEATRVAASKRQVALLQRYRRAFVRGAFEQGVTRTTAREFFDDLLQRL
jgi:hypothetical protein